MANNTTQMGYNFHNNETSVVEGVRRRVLQRKPKREIEYEFSVHYHPYVDELIEKLNREGLLSMMDV
ncbi:MAG: Toxin, partial [Acidobacteriota bacterium]|nr:Toxin [Acidobacteriota bacterium]